MKFISYAVWWIRQSIQAYIKKEQLSSSIVINEAEEYNGQMRESIIDDEEDEIVNKNEVILSNEEDENNKELEKSQRKVIKNLLSKLNDREKYIINAYFGLDGKKPKTLEQIGKELGMISRERVRQIKVKSLRILRSELMMMDEDMMMLFK